MRQNRLALCVAIALIPGTASALSDDDVNRALQFSFSNPGARSLALGGAFTGLADDATAAYANPAGLTILRSKQFAIEGRNIGYDTDFASGGQAVISPFDRSGVGSASASNDVAQLSFLSFVYPTERATFSLFYHRIGDFETSYGADSIHLVDRNGNPTDELIPTRAHLSYEVQNFGGAVGFKVSETFSLGLTVAYSDFSIDSIDQRFDRATDTVPFNVQRQDGGDDDIVYSLGALWQLTPQWNLGLAYRSGGNFNYDGSNTIVASGDQLQFSPSFDVPNIFSAGLAFRPSDAWLFTLDVNFIEYSRLTDNIESAFNEPTAPRIEIDDGTEIRFGAEYAFLEMTTPLFLRGGVWRDPDHRLAFSGAAPTNCNVNVTDCLTATLYTQGDDEMHYSVGFGWSFEKFQLDFAADLSDVVDIYSASGVWRF